MKKIIIALFLPLFGFSQVSITGAGNYTQDFNTLASTGTANAWIDNTTLPNWFSQRTGTGTTYDASTGSGTAGNLYSYGVTAATERALGTQGSGGAAAGHFAHGILFQNNSSLSITDFTVSYTLEQWRKSGVTVSQDITFWYKKSSATISALNPNSNATWTQITLLSATSPINTATAAALDGNLPANKISLTSITIPSLNLTPGEFLMLKWEDPDHAGSDHGLAIDDVTISWVTSCISTASISTTVCTSYTVPSGDETYTASGIYMDTIPNAALCDSILTIDLTITTGITYYADVDTDGLGDPNNTAVACTLPLGFVTNSDDCDDNNIAIGVATTTYYQDFDNDTYGSATITIVACTQPVGYVTNNLDCNDADNTINPAALDIQDNGIDEDCSGSDASAFGTQIGIYEFTQAAACPVTALSVTAQPTNALFSDYSSTGTSCSSAANVFSNSGWNLTAIIDTGEYNQFTINSVGCNSLDLNKLIFTHRISSSGGTPTWTLRSSLDNFTADLASGTPLTTDKTDTVILSPAFDALTSVTFRFYITNMGTTGSTWRNDNVRLIGNFGTLTPQTFYADLDGDTYGDVNSTVSACIAPVGYVSNTTDCDDTDAAINPTTVWYEDADGDTYGNTSASFTGCTPPSNYVLQNNDCNDAVAGVNPGSPEICDGLDNNCNTSVDEGLTFTSYYIDADNDNFGAGLPQSFCSNPGAGFALFDGDCDDSNPNAYPGATEILDNLMDENCDGTDNYLGINENSSNVISVYPNPSNGLFTVNFNTTVQGIITVFDLNGQVLVEQMINTATMNLDLSALSNGNYILKITTEFGVNQKRIVVQK